MQLKIPASFWRGGTSRAVFFKEEDLASYDAPTRDLIILAALGSPDPVWPAGRWVGWRHLVTQQSGHYRSRRRR